MPDALFMFRDRQIAPASCPAAKPRCRLCLRSHSERRCFLRSGGGSSEQGEVSRERSTLPIRQEVAMGTLVTIQIVGSASEDSAHAAMDRAFGWFHEIEARCSRFSERSELMLLTAQAGVAVPASAILYQAVQFALMVAEATGGAFDPTIGHRMHAHGFNREHRTGEIVRNLCAPDDDISYRDVQVDPDRRTITLR